MIFLKKSSRGSPTKVALYVTRDLGASGAELRCQSCSSWVCSDGNGRWRSQRGMLQLPILRTYVLLQEQHDCRCHNYNGSPFPLRSLWWHRCIFAMIKLIFPQPALSQFEFFAKASGRLSPRHNRHRKLHHDRPRRHGNTSMQPLSLLVLVLVLYWTGNFR